MSSKAAIGEEMTLGYEPPRLVQFSVFLDNRCGKLLELLKVFDGQACELAAINVLDSADHAVVRLLTSRAELARRLLKRNKFAFSECDVIAVELRPGQSLANICENLLAAELNIHYTYPLIVRPHSLPGFVLNTDDQTVAGQILRRKLFHLLAENDLGENKSHGDPFDTTAN